jgi:signal transduction histidine kinase
VVEESGVGVKVVNLTVTSAAATWSRLSPAQKYGAAAVIPIGLVLALFPGWINNEIGSGILRNSDGLRGGYLESFISPLVRGLATPSDLSHFSREAIAALLADMQQELARTRVKFWLIIGLIAIVTAGVLSVIVSRGSRIISEQRRALIARVSELSRLLIENIELQKNLRRANACVAQENERFLRQIGADLHDGPAQLISLALLRLDNLKPGGNINSDSDHEAELARVCGALRDALVEIRALSAGIAPPCLNGLSPSDAIEIAARTHERRTGTAVKREIGRLPGKLSSPLQICIYRFTQEGLNNAYRHAAGKGQAVRATYEGGQLTIEVSDTGRGIAQRDPGNGNSLGFAGLQARVESLEGKFEWESRANSGTRLVARFRI